MRSTKESTCANDLNFSVSAGTVASDLVWGKAMSLVENLREVADRLRIQGEYGPGWSDVADATACTLGADEIVRYRTALEKIASVNDAPICHWIALRSLKGQSIDLPPGQHRLAGREVDGNAR
jgi:hypothetical protein